MSLLRHRCLKSANNVLTRCSRYRSWGAIHLRHRHLSSGAQPSKLSPWGKRTGSALLCLMGGAGALYYNHYDEENWRRSLYFWGNLYPIYLHYRWMQFYTQFAKMDEHEADKAFNRLHERYKQTIYDIVVELQGFYIKLGQLGAARTDIIPVQWVELLRKLEDECPAQPFAVIEEIIKKDFGIQDTAELFAYIDPKPLGAASIGQTHFVRLKNGDEAVIKVQYPNVEAVFRGDFVMARKFCEMAQPAHLPFVDETEKQFLTEFDYVLEAQNLEEIGNNLNDQSLWKHRVRVPKPYKSLCREHVLVMEYLKGHKMIKALKTNFTALAKERNMTLDEFVEEQKKLEITPSASDMKRIHYQIMLRDHAWNVLAVLCNYSFGFLFQAMGHDTGELIPYKKNTLPLNMKLILDLVSDVHAYQVFMNGAFNGDPHPGNLILCDDGKLGLIDYGQVKHLNLAQRIELAKLIIYLGDDDTSRIINAMTESIGFRTKYMDEWVIEKSARFYFDRDDSEVTEGMNVQLFLEYLNRKDPIKKMSDDYVMVGRLKMLISGLHHSLGYRFSAAHSWRKWAQTLLAQHEVDPYSA